MVNEPIDFVLLWVDGDDPEWQKLFLKYKGADGDSRPLRFRDMGLLRYWFRGVEKFAPWVNKIYFVTCGQRPEWLNTAHPKLVCVTHDEYIPKEYLPTFSSHTIELNLHRISKLSQQFVYFNDDMFFTRETQSKDFFVKGLPCDQAIMEYTIPSEYPFFLVPVANASLLNRNFSKKEVMLRHFGKFFSHKYRLEVLKNIKHFTGKNIPGFHSTHLPNSFLRSTFDEVWAAEQELLDEVCRHRFRAYSDVNQWAIQGWQRCTGRISPQRYKGKCFYIWSVAELENAVKAITDQKYKMLCLNDNLAENFEQAKAKLQSAFEQILPQKSAFEL